MLQPPSERGQADERAQAAPLEADPGAQSAGDPTHGSGGYMGPAGLDRNTKRSGLSPLELWLLTGELWAQHRHGASLVEWLGATGWRG
jgi:hypothetical protein